jgi:type V secretory pathway adhesin AidA
MKRISVHSGPNTNALTNGTLSPAAPLQVHLEDVAGWAEHREANMGSTSGDSNGELVLEILVIEGKATTVLMPEDRSAPMRSAWFLPSVAALRFTVPWLSIAMIA